MRWRRAIQAAFAIVLLVATAAVLVQAFPGVVGADYALTVQSGSMEPAMMTGSTVFVVDVPPERIAEGDIITYRDDGRNLVTHRVVERHSGPTSIRFTTKGDNNDAADAEPVYRNDVLGMVASWDVPVIGTVYGIPIVGYLVAFAQTTAGYVVLVLVPVSLIIVSEVWTLYQRGVSDT